MLEFNPFTFFFNIFQTLEKLSSTLFDFLYLEIDLQIIEPISLITLLGSGLLITILVAVLVKKIVPFL